MKTTKFILSFLVLIASITFTSCVEDGKFEIPNALGTEENEALNKLLTEATNGSFSEISIANLKGLLVNGQVTQITSDIYVKGYVTSSDQTGNFFKEFFIQDAPTNATAAIKVVTEFVDSYNKFNIGREVYIRLKGLYIGEVRTGDGVTAIGGGEFSAGRLGTLSVKQTGANVLRATNSEEIEPIVVKFSEINNSHVGLFVKVENAQFPSSIVGKTYVDAADQFDTQRLLESCDGFGYTNFILETSSFAEFRFSVLPAGGGSVSGVVSKTFNGSSLVLALNKPSDVIMEQARCSPLNIADFNLIFDEGFNDVTTNWTAHNITGAETWGITTFGNPGNAARMSGFSGTAKVNEDWLVSKAINISAASNAFLIFETVKRFAGNNIELFYSKNYTSGSPVTNGTWVKLNPVLDTNVNSWNSWASSGAIDLTPAVGGNVFIAFKYTSDTANAATFQIDNLKVLTK